MVTTTVASLQVHVLRLPPGADLRDALAAAGRELPVAGVGVVCAVGSLSAAVLRYADQPQGVPLAGRLELLSLSGTLGAGGVHLHASVADAQGEVRGGHVMPGCTVRTTAEVVLALLPDWHLGREFDPATGFKELVARRLEPHEITEDQ